MLTVDSTLTLWHGESARWHFVSVPAEDSVEIRAHSLVSRGGSGAVKVEATINGISWRTSIFPQKSGGYLLPVKASVRRDAGIAAGDRLTVTLELV